MSVERRKGANLTMDFVGRNQVMVAINNRGDVLDGGVSSFDALDKAANAFVKTYAPTGNVQKAVDAANTVLRSIPGNEKENVGDEIKKKPVN